MRTLLEKEQRLEARGRGRRSAGKTASKLAIAWKRSWRRRAAEISMFGF